MSAILHEWRLLARSRWAMAGLLLLFILSTLSVYSGLREVSHQRQAITQLAELQNQTLIAQQPKLTRRGDAGTVAYYANQATWDEPSSAAFLALGLRDTAPYVLRVRALALQAQLHEGESFNPELALAGRFDFAFVLVYLAPLFLIALLYDLVSSERHAGRLTTLLSLPNAGRSLWLRRALLRAGLAFAAMTLPLLVGFAVSGSSPLSSAVVLVATFAYMVFWTGVALFVASRGCGSVSNAMTLMGCWAVLVLVLPTVANAVLARAIPVPQGVELMLAQRQAVHAAWDVPREDTMQRFLRTHPEWEDTAPLPKGFHWKWYFAFQHLGDESVAPQVNAYREGLRARQRWTERMGWLLPGVGAQTILHRTADTDLVSQLAYQDAISAYHGRLRAYFYPYLFRDKHFGPEDFARLPRFEAAKRIEDAPVVSLLALVAVGLVAWLLSLSRLKLVGSASSAPQAKSGLR